MIAKGNGRKSATQRAAKIVVGGFRVAVGYPREIELKFKAANKSETTPQI
jgi:hypothetical protein